MAAPSVDRNPLEKPRLDAFCDGVFGFALTVLVVELALPNMAGEEVRRGLRDLWPSFLAFALSFVRIANLWINHHTLLARAERASYGLVWSSVLVLFFVVLLPFPTAVLADHLLDEGGRVAALLYLAVSAGAVGALLVCNVHMRRRPEVVAPAYRELLPPNRLIARTLLAYVATAPLAIIGGLAFLIGHAAVVMYFSVPYSTRARYWSRRGVGSKRQR